MNSSDVGASAMAENAAGRKKRVLLFLEDLFFLSRVENACRAFLLETEITANLGKLQAFLSEAEKENCLLIVDFNLNREQIPEIIAEIRQSKPNLPIVGFASFRQQQLLESCKLAGATEVYVKADFMEALDAIIKRFSES